MRTDRGPLKTNRWAAVRAHIAQRASYRCQHCHQFLGMTGQVDHVVPRSDCEDVGIGVYDPSNLQYLCTSCHSRKSNAERWARAPRSTKGRNPLRRAKVAGRDAYLHAAGISSIEIKGNDPPNVEISYNPNGAIRSP